MSAASPIGLWLHDLTGNGELQLLDSTGQVLASSTLGLGLDEVIQRSLAAGTYGIRVFHNEVNAQMAYQLDWTTTPSQVSIGSGMQLALASDTGISNSDGITNQSSVTVQGTGQTGSVVTILDQTQQVLGQTRIGANGQWQLSLAELADGSYGLTAQVTNPWGYSTTGNALAITIDTVAPNQAISGILNGITWQSSDQIQATITDLGVGLANVTYQLDNQTPQAWTGNNGQWSKSVSDLLNWNEPNQQGSHTLTFRSLDRAGNLQTEQYSFSVPKPFTWTDSDLWTGSTDPNDANTSGDNLVAPPLGGSGGQSGGGERSCPVWLGG